MARRCPSCGARSASRVCPACHRVITASTFPAPLPGERGLRLVALLGLGASMGLGLNGELHRLEAVLALGVFAVGLGGAAFADVGHALGRRLRAARAAAQAAELARQAELLALPARPDLPDDLELQFQDRFLARWGRLRRTEVLADADRLEVRRPGATLLHLDADDVQGLVLESPPGAPAALVAELRRGRRQVLLPCLVSKQLGAVLLVGLRRALGLDRARQPAQPPDADWPGE